MDIDILSHAPETKAGIAGGGAVTHDDVMRLFEDFKSANDERLDEIERRSADVVTDDKVERINAALTRRLDDLALKSARPSLGSPAGRESAAVTADAIEHKAAFDAYMRTGESAGLRALEVKAMSVGSNPDGGYVVPVEIEQAIGARLTAISPIRAIAGQRTISGNVYKKPFMTAGPAVGWVGETDARTQTTSPTLDALSFPAMELYAMPAATATLLEDSRRQHRRMARRRGGAGLRRAGGHGLRHRRRRQQAEGLPRLRHRRQRVVGLGQARLCRDRRRRARSRRAIRPTCWSI